MIYINGSFIYNLLGENRFMEEEKYLLNEFILDNQNPVTIDLIIKPGYDEEGNKRETIIKESYITAVLRKENAHDELLSHVTIFDNEEYVTDTIVEEGNTRYYTYPGTSHYGMKEFKKQYNFIPEVSYNVEGWKNGKDLRNDLQLKQKIIQLYQKLAHIIESNDSKALNDFFYTLYKERAISSYNMKAPFSYEDWENFLFMMEYGYRYDVEQDFKIEYSQDGKLIYASPNKNKDMLRVIGKEYAEGFTFYMYEDATTNELKFIR